MCYLLNIGLKCWWRIKQFQKSVLVLVNSNLWAFYELLWWCSIIIAFTLICVCFCAKLRWYEWWMTAQVMEDCTSDGRLHKWWKTAQMMQMTAQAGMANTAQAGLVNAAQAIIAITWSLVTLESITLWSITLGQSHLVNHTSAAHILVTHSNSPPYWHVIQYLFTTIKAYHQPWTRRRFGSKIVRASPFVR